MMILVVDDHPLNRQLACKVVERAGYCAVEAADGPEAVARWKQGDIDLILMDLEMPSMDGADTTRLIRAAEQKHTPGCHIPIVGLSAHIRPEDRERALASGMDDYVGKPVQLEILLATIRQLCVFDQSG